MFLASSTPPPNPNPARSRSDEQNFRLQPRPTEPGSAVLARTPGSGSTLEFGDFALEQELTEGRACGIAEPGSSTARATLGAGAQ